MRERGPASVENIRMFANSRQIQSPQTAPHPRLHEVVRKHLATPYQRQPSDAGARAFADVADQLAQKLFVLDAGCGTGASTLALALEFPDHLVLGVDKSAARLATGQRSIDGCSAPANARLLHCELVDFWQLAAAAGLRCERQFLLYPNPWPKPEHLMRRWHAHPVFPQILALGGVIELRSNWRVYAEEFAAALEIAGVANTCEAFAPGEPLTPFERKYQASGHALWWVQGTI
jgi:tRNA (guanine-N7-)-methyltransferase